MNHQTDTDEASIARLTAHLSEHIETRLEYAQLSFFEKFSVAYARHSSVGIMTNIFMLILAFTGGAAALWIGKHYEDYALGFGSVGLFYVVCMFLYMILRKSVFEKKIADKVITALCKEEENDEEDEEA